MVTGNSNSEQARPRKRRRLRRRWIVLIVVAAVIVALVVATFVSAHYTSRSSFCRNCHEMEPYYSSWQASSHANTRCTDCHIPPGFVAYVESKLFSLREVWVHITGAVEVPLAVSREIPNASCFRCHTIPEDLNLGNDPFSHQLHEDQYCITCHVRIVHADVNPPYYKPPAAMSSCFDCHEGKTAPNECSACHTPLHQPYGECSACHTTQSWTGGAGVEHSLPLTGGHADLACFDCHATGAGADLIPGTALPRPDPACISCHGNRHNGLNDCSRCHSVAGWKPADFTHPRVAHRPSTEVGPSCANCHPSGYGSHTCSKCHSGGFDDDDGDGDEREDD